VVTLRDAGPPAAGLPDDVACCALGARGRRRTTVRSLRWILRNWNADVVHARNTGCWTDAVLASLGRRSRVVLGFHGLDHRGLLDAKTRWIVRLARCLDAAYTSVSECGRQRLHREAGVPPDRTTVLRTGVDLSCATAVHRRHAVRAALSLPAEAFVVGTVGSLTPVKRPDLLIEAACLLHRKGSQLHVLLIGDGPLGETLRHQIEKRGLADHIQLLGAREGVPDLLPALDAYVCASDSEEMSNSLLEAMAAGVPAISTDVGDHADIIRAGQAGLIVPRGSTVALAEAIESLERLPALRQRLARAARKRAFDFDFAQTVRSYQSFYASLTRDSASVPTRVPRRFGRAMPAPG
jgi:glycosyltransferase involved in cell wall biosynthesis